MSVNYKIDILDHPDCLESSKFNNNYFHILFKDVMEILKAEYSKKSIKFKFNYKYALEESDYDSVPQKPAEDIKIRTIFYNDIDYIKDSFFAPDNSLGFHSITSPNTDSGLNDSHEVFVNCNYSFLFNICLNSRKDEFDIHSDRYDSEILDALLVTLTHELEHAVEFIENANGLTPHELDSMGILTSEISYGIFSLKETANVFFGQEYDDLIFDEKYLILEEMMEERIEEKGKKVLNNVVAQIQNLDSYKYCLECLSTDLNKTLESKANIDGLCL